jgi:hypothetical protein
MRESALIQKLRDWLAGNGGIAYKYHGGARSMRGIPDLLVIYGGQTYFVETKVKGGKPKKHQTDRIEEINRHGGRAFYADSLNDFISKL